MGDVLTIRVATARNMPRIVELGRRALIDGPYAGVLEDNPEQAVKLATMVMLKGTVLLATVGEHVCGVLGFITTAHHISGSLYSTELIWYVEPEYRQGKGFFDGPAFDLMREAERRSLEAGAEFIAFTAPSDNIGSMYLRLGYRPLEVVYWKRLNALPVPERNAICQRLAQR